MDIIQRRFRLPEILNVLLFYDGSQRPSGDVRVLLRYMVGPSATDAELASAASRCVDAVLAAHPDLAAVYELDVPTPELAEEWIRRRIAEFGEYLTVPRLRCPDSLPSDQTLRDDSTESDS